MISKKVGPSPDRRPEPVPGQARTLASPPQPLVPRVLRFANEPPEATDVAIHPEVVEVPLNATHQRCVLLGNRPVPMAPAPIVDSAYRPP